MSNMIIRGLILVQAAFMFTLPAMSYDGELIEYYSHVDVRSEYFHKYADKLKIPELVENDLSYELILITPKNFSLIEKQGGVFGMFFVHEFGVFEKFDDPFSHAQLDVKNFRVDDDTENRHFKGGTIGQHLSIWYNMLGLSVVELYDSNMTSIGYDVLKGVDSIKVLGLPKLGVIFEEGFALPPNIEVLVVRNSTLNSHFFDALSSCSQLKRIVFNKCSIECPEPMPNQFSYYLDYSWEGFKNIFSDVNQTVEEIEIKDSDPMIFNCIFSKKWPNLNYLKVDLYMNNSIALNTMLVSKNELLFYFKKISVCHFTLDEFNLKDIQERVDRLRVTHSAQFILHGRR